MYFFNTRSKNLILVTRFEVLGKYIFVCDKLRSSVNLLKQRKNKNKKIRHGTKFRTKKQCNFLMHYGYHHAD